MLRSKERHGKRLITGPGISDILWILALIALVALTPSFLLLAPQLIEYVRSINIPELQLPSPNQTTPQEAFTPDMQRYLGLKNASCGTLSKDFLIATSDISEGSMAGLSGAEGAVARSMLAAYGFNQTTRTYTRGDWLKRVVTTQNTEHTTVWKEGRIYQCNPNCTMQLLGDEGWQAHLDTLSDMRTRCAHFGKTKLPASVDISRLMKVERTGTKTINGFRCEAFLIRGNSTYAESLLPSNMSLDEDQRAILWLLSHLAGPVEECLDDGTGILVYRNITLDLTGSYRFDYAPGGYMHVNQQTMLTYYTDNVPESFLALPG